MNNSRPFELFLANSDSSEEWKYDINKKVLIINNEEFELKERTEDKFQNRLRHNCLWCSQRQRSFNYDQVFFPENVGRVYSRTIDFRPIDHTIIIKLSPAQNFDQVIFKNSFDSNLLNSLSEVLLVSEAEPVDEPGPRIIYVNDRFTEMTGYEREEVLGLNPRLLQGDETSEENKAIIREGLLHWHEIKVPLVNYKKSGERFEVELNIRPVKDETGWWSHWISIQRDITEEKKVLSKLKSDQHIFQKLQEMANIGIWMMNLKTEEITWSDQVYEIHQVEPGTEIVKKMGISFYAPHEQQRITDLVEKSINEKIPFSGEFEFIDAKGQKKWVQSYGEPIFDNNGMITHLAGTFQDISLLRETQRNLVKQNEELRNFKQGVDSYAIVAATDKAGKITYVNDLFVKISGYSREELIGQDHRIINSGYHDKEFFKNLWNTINRGELWRGEVKNKNKEGSFYWVDTVITPQHDIDGKISGFISFRNEITQRKTSEVMANSLALLRRTYIDYSSVGADFFTFLLGHMLEATNSKYGFIIKRDDESVSGKEFLALSIELSKDEIVSNESLKQVIDWDHISQLYSYHLDNFSISTLEISSILSITFLRRDQVIGKMILFNRIDENPMVNLKKYEPLFSGISEIFFHHTVEEEVARQKVITLHQAKLASVGELAAGIGHEINNPLTVVTSYIEKIKKDFSSGQSKEFLEIIKKMDLSVDRITAITNGLRKFARNDQSIGESFELNTVIKETLDMITEIYKQDGINLSLKTTEDNYFIVGEQGRLQQVIMNLLSNARDALQKNDHKEIKIRIEEQGEFIQILIEDNGPGIPKNLQRKIFDAFYTTKKIGRGTGLGLSLSSTAIKEFGGDLTLNSELNHGSCFIISLPYQKDVSILVPPPSTDNTSEEIVKSPKIMIVDDEEGIREILYDILEEFSDNISSYSCAEDAYAVYCENPENYDIIISDIKMPGWDGTTFLKVLRENKEIKQPQFVFITGGVNFDFSSEKSDLKGKFDGHIYKPFKRLEIENLITKLVKTKEE